MVSKPEEPRFDGRGGRWIGASVRRREDPRLVTGRGRFVDDIHLHGMLHAGFVRATVAHGKIAELDLGATREVDGVVAAYSAEDLQLGDMVALLDRPPEEFTPTTMPILARGKVRFVGEPIALVIAKDPYAVEDGIEAAQVSYEVLDAVVSEETALAENAPLVHEDAPSNVLLDVTSFDTPGVDEAFAEGCVIELVTRSGRQNALPLETRGAVASWDDRDEQLLVQTCSQVPHQVRTVLARSLRIPERSVRVVVPDMGGGFGQKCVVGREEIAVAAAAKRLRRPVKWIEDRGEALASGFLAREQRYRTRAAFTPDGELTALESDIVCDMGAYSCYPFTVGIEPLMAAAEMPSVYRVPAYRVRARAITSNKAPTAPYRGVSRPQYVMVMERIMDLAARELGLDPVEIRRRNVITEFPYVGVNKVTYDPGSYLESLELGEKILRDEGWYELREKNPHIGIGYSCFSERTGYGSEAFAKRKMTVVPGFDVSEIRMDLTGSVVVTSGTINHGQSHETTFAQIVAERLGVDLAKVKLRQGDTERISYGWGTFASRSVTIGGSAVATAATRLGEQLCVIAAHLMDTRVENVGLDGDGGVIQLDDPNAAAVVRGDRRRRVPAQPSAAQGSRADAHRHRGVRRPRRRHVLERDARGRGGGGSGHRPGENPPLRLRRGLRRGDQPEGRRRPGARRDRAGHHAARCSRRSPTRRTANRRRRASSTTSSRPPRRSPTSPSTISKPLAPSLKAARRERGRAARSARPPRC